MSDTQIKKQAVLIGINDYDVLPQLKYARQDAESVAQSLKYNYCFSENEVTLLTDALDGVFRPSNRVRILSQLDTLANKELDLFIFGFWGHGVVHNGKRYLCPKDISQDEVEELGIPFDDLMSKLTKIRAKNTCLILDCCQSVHDGKRGEEETLTVADQKTIENAARDIIFNRKKKEPEFQSNVAILNSCKQGQAAYEWDNRKHGIFTAHLLDAMNRRFNTVSQIVSYVTQNVETTAKELGKKQTPLCSLEGDIQLPVDTKSSPLITGDVFVSYRHRNADLVAPIEEELKKRGISYFIDRVGVDYTMQYAEALALAVKACKVLLFVWTQDADVSPDILREVSMALALKKRVLPYKIGSFNVTDHDSLFFQLSPISRYEVPEQTSETITELVNQVQRALTEKTYQQYSFIIPDNSAEAVIVRPETGNIDIAISPTIIEQQQPIRYDKITLPPKPEELLRIPAENEALRDAIEQLKSFTHESLAQANIALQQTEAQLELWKNRREERWEDLPKKIRESWEQAIANNPDCTKNDIDLQKTWEEMIADKSFNTDELQNQLYFDLLEKFHCGKKYQQAKLELERVEQERKSKCDEVIARFQQQIEDNERHYDGCVNKFFDDVLLMILSIMDGYDVVNAEFPEEKVIVPLRQLDKYELGWKAPKEAERAKELWEENRPCVIAERKRIEEEQQQIAAKEEERRKQLEAEEAKKRKQLEAEEEKKRRKLEAEKKREENNKKWEEWKNTWRDWWQETKNKWGEWWQESKKRIKYIFLLIIGILLFVFCRTMYMSSCSTDEYSFQIFYMFVSSCSFNLGLLLTISAVVILWNGFDWEQLTRSLMRCFSFLALITLILMGGRITYYAFVGDYVNEALSEFWVCSFYLLFLPTLFSIILSIIITDDLKSASTIIWRTIAPILLFFWGTVIIVNETLNPSINEELLFIKDKTTYMNTLGSTSQIFRFVGYSSFLNGILLILFIIGLIYFLAKNNKKNE